MRFFSQIATVAALVSLVSAHAIRRSNLKTSETAAVAVELSSAGGHNVLVSVKNTGAKDLRIFNKGTLLDKANVGGFKVTQDGQHIKFVGIREYLIYNEMPESFFTDIAIGKTHEFTANLAETYDLDLGGDFEVWVEDFFNLAAGPASNEFGEEMVSFVSNHLHIDVDGSEAAKVAKPYGSIDKRSLLAYGECNGDQVGMIHRAMDNCARIANDAGWHAVNGDAGKFNEYFRTADGTVRQAASDRFNAIAAECRARDGGRITVHCADVENFCGPNVAAYATAWKDLTVMCPPWWGVLADTQWCHWNDQADIFVHELSHLNLPGALPGTRDVTYGYQNIVNLNTNDALNNADTYALYSNAIKFRC